ncbi:MAG: hypothetical protein ACTSXH_11790 [Promethearchaeota archaeon]
MSIFEICGSPCEYWWSWLINFPPRAYCILVCRPRNSLYKLFFILGLIFLSGFVAIRFMFEEKKEEKR